MNKTKQKKIKKLSTSHIWPSVVFLVFSLLLAATSFFISMALFVGYIFEDRMDSACQKSYIIAKSIDNAGEDFEDILGDIKKSADEDGAVIIRDSAGNVIAGFGEASFVDREMTISTISSVISYANGIENTEYVVMADVDRSLLNDEGDIELKFLFSKDNLKNIIESSNLTNDKMFSMSFWVKFRLANDNDVCVKCNIPLYRVDIMASIAVGATTVVVMMLPVIFLLISMINSVRNQRKLTALLYTDTITGGKNRLYFEINADKSLKLRRNQMKLMAVVDITILKYTNYCAFHGAKQGEELLENVDKTLCRHIYPKKNEICSHYEKASFALFLKCGSKNECENRVNEIIGELSKLYDHGGIVFQAGIYFCEPIKTKDGKETLFKRITDGADCFNRAGTARATIADGNHAGVAVYDDKLLEEKIWEHKVEEKMHEALANEEFSVFIQPKYDPVTRELAGGEALVRWINDEDGFISPGRFIPIFENNGFITRLDDYMISHVAALQAQWIAEGKPVVPISVNVSRAHFANPDLAQHICKLVDAYNVPHDLIEIELTESAFFDDKAALLRTVHALGDLGFEISMDDFGAGYSSLNSLKDLPLNVLKLDAEFFRGESEENRGEIVISEAISLAKKLNMRIVAEGVEKKDQVDFLAKQGCDMIQGYYFARPMPAAEYAGKLGKTAEVDEPAVPKETVSAPVIPESAPVIPESAPVIAESAPVIAESSSEGADDEMVPFIAEENND